MEAIVRGRHGNPFAALGMHGGQGKPVAVNVFMPQAAEVEVIGEDGAVLAKLERIHREGFFSGFIPDRTERFPYRLRLRAGDSSWDVHDPYSFPPVLGEVDEYLLGEGRHRDLYRRLGAHAMVLEGIEGVLFSVWAPNARRVSVVGDFNAWDGRRHPMRKRIGVGIWELFIPGIGLGALYKFEILGVHGDSLPLKADPLSFAQETPPATASIVCGPVEHQWKDGEWMNSRGIGVATSRPISIYEVHLGSWRRGGNAELLDYETLADMLSSYALDMGFTHVELLPVTEHPFGGSWGYQPVGLFAPTRRFGPPKGFARFVDRLHQSGIGVILDWVPAHFPSDDYGLSRFDGTALYEHEDPRLGFHRDWNTLIYNFGRLEVANFLQASALYWLDCLHADGLRVDAVASMLYLDYSRQPGEWMPNRYGGNENLDAIEFLRDTNRLIGERYPDTLTIAEESTAWAGVSRPPDQGGLGFSFKWNMGWMHDSLSYMQLDPIYRRHHHHQMTFASSYASSENFVLPLSHDEVVHGKGSLLGKMPGDRWQKFANLRAYFGFMWGHPGKKLLFMGGEFGQEREWNHDQSLDWHLLDDPMHRGVQDLVRDLNRLYREHRPLHQLDCSDAGFQWVEADDLDNSVYSFLRWSEDRKEVVLVISNMTPVVRENYRVGVPYPGAWRVLMNTDDGRYGGSHVSSSPTDAEEPGWQRQPASLRLNVPPLATLYLAPAG